MTTLTWTRFLPGFWVASVAPGHERHRLLDDDDGWEERDFVCGPDGSWDYVGEPRALSASDRRASA